LALRTRRERKGVESKWLPRTRVEMAVQIWL
jgi:hypothetical protein